MGVQSTSHFQAAIDAFRVAEAGKFRQTVGQQGELHKTAGAGGVKGKLVAWIASTPGREGTLAGRAVKALVNLFGAGKFEAVSSALQQSRETSVHNMLNTILRQAQGQLDADFSQTFSGTVTSRRERQGTNFAARDFVGLQNTMKDLIAKQNQARQEAIAAVQNGAPSARMTALNPAELRFAVDVLAPANDGGQRRVSKFPEGVSPEKFNAVDKELNTMARRLRERLNDTPVVPAETYTVNSLKQEGRLNDDFHLQEARTAVLQRVNDFRQSYVNALQSLLPQQAAPATAPAHTPPQTAASPQATPPQSEPSAAQLLQQEYNEVESRYHQAQTNHEASKAMYADAKRRAEGKKTDGVIPPAEQKKVDTYRKLAQDAGQKVSQLAQQLAELDQRLTA